MATDIEKPSVKKIDLNGIEDIIHSVRANYSDTAAVKRIIEQDRPTVEAAARLNRHLNSVGLPFTTRLQMKVDENPWLAPVDATFSTAGKVAGGILIGQGVMWLYRFARGLV